MSLTTDPTCQTRPTSQTVPVPERPETLRHQMDWLREGKRKCVLVTPGEELPEVPAEFITVYIRSGLLIYNPHLITAREIGDALARDCLGELLGYGIGTKPQPGSEAGAVVIRHRNGCEKQAVVTDNQQLSKVLAAANKMASEGDKVAVEPCEKVIAARQAGFLDAWPKLWPLKSEEEVEQVLRAAKEQGQQPILPTHWVEKDGEIVGAVSVSSVPLYLLWLHKDKVKPRETLGLLNVIENSFRSSRVRMVATMIDGDSPFAGQAERCGYQPASGQLYWRKL